MTSGDPASPREPSYAELPDGSATGVFGVGDVFGTLNRMSPASVRAGVATTRKGAVFPLNLPIDEPDPPLLGRKAPVHQVFRTPSGNLDDTVDRFYLQGSSQWDGFLHIADPDTGHYNGLGDAEHGIHHWAERGIVGRGVVLDVAPDISGAAVQEPYAARVELGVDSLEAARERGGVEYTRGDILVLHTGWLSWYRSLAPPDRERVSGMRTSPGLRACPEVAAYLWDMGFSAVVSDNPAVESMPTRPEFSLHRRVLSRLGMPFGELWWLADLVDDCRQDGVHECLIASAPLNVHGGVGSPANALALK